MKTIRITACVLLAALFLTVMVSCGGGADSIVGKWAAEVEGVEMSFEFKEDGTGTMGTMGVNMDITWEIEGTNTLIVEMNFMGMSETTEFEFEVKGNELSLTADGETVVLTKK